MNINKHKSWFLPALVSLLTAMPAYAGGIREMPKRHSYVGHIKSDRLGSYHVYGETKKRKLILSLEKDGKRVGWASGRLYLSKSKCLTGKAKINGKVKRFGLYSCGYDSVRKVFSARIGRLNGGIPSSLRDAAVETANVGNPMVSSSLNTIELTSASATSGTLYFDYDYLDVDPKASRTPISEFRVANYQSLLISNVVAGAMLGHLVRQHYTQSDGTVSVVIDRDHMYTSMISHLLKEAGSQLNSTAYSDDLNSRTLLDTGTVAYCQLMYSGQGGAYQMNDWAQGVYWDNSKGGNLGVIDFVSLQQGLSPWSVAREANPDQNDPNTLTPDNLNDKYFAPMVVAYHKYLNLLGMEHYDAFSNTTWVKGCVSTSMNNLSGFPASNILDMAVSQAYNSGSMLNGIAPSNGVTPAEAYLRLCGATTDVAPKEVPSVDGCKAVITGATSPLASSNPNQAINCLINNNSIDASASNQANIVGPEVFVTQMGITDDASRPHGSEYPFWPNYARQIRYVSNQVLGQYLEGYRSNLDYALFPPADSLATGAVYGVNIIFPTSDLISVFVSSMTTLGYYNGVTYKLIDQATAMKAITDAVGGAYTSFNLSLINNPNGIVADPTVGDRTALFNALDTAIMTVKNALNIDFSKIDKDRYAQSSSTPPYTDMNPTWKANCIKDDAGIKHK